MGKKVSQVRRVRLQKGKTLVLRGRVWYLETCSEGVQRLRTLGTKDLQEATKKAAEGTSEAPPPATRQDPPTQTLTEALDDYEEWYEKNKRASGLRRVMPVLRWFVESVGESSGPGQVTREDVQKFVDGRSDGRSPITTRNDFARVRAFIRWMASRQKGADPRSCLGVEVPKDDSVTREAPSVEKVRKVISRLGTHGWMGDFATVLAETGLRPAELLGVRGTDLRGKLLTIAPWDGRELKSKWSKRTLELNETARTILKAREEQMFEKDRPIFSTETGTVYKPDSARNLFEKVLTEEDTGEIPSDLKMTLYDFRHFFCSEHAAPGPQHMPLETLAAYIGHSPKSQDTLLRWYTDQNALRRGAPPQLTRRPKKSGKVLAIRHTGG